jgi:hypothetical protein
MKKYTVFFDQRNRTNYQILARNMAEAEMKAIKLYKKNFLTPCPNTQEGWLSEEDGEDE